MEKAFTISYGFRTIQRLRPHQKWWGFVVSGGEIVKIYACSFHPNGFFISCEARGDFWYFLSPLIGWGRFSMLCIETEFSPTGGLFQLVEVLPADSTPPESVTEGSNVLWRLPEAREALKLTPPSDLQGFVKCE